MASNSKFNRWWVTTSVFVALCLTATVANAETYRWKDENGKVHYGSTVPAEYADQPYDVLNSAGLVIRHVEDSTIPLEVRVEEEVKGKEPLISDEERQIQTDRLLIIQYKSEAEIQAALDLELSQLGYDIKLIRQSQESTTKTIREQIKLVANRQRANLDIPDDKVQAIERLYLRRDKDNTKLAAVEKREHRIRDRFQAKLERYRHLTSDTNKDVEEPTDQG